MLLRYAVRSKKRDRVEKIIVILYYSPISVCIVALDDIAHATQRREEYQIVDFEPKCTCRLYSYA
jgi:hypothetical protein